MKGEITEVIKDFTNADDMWATWIISNLLSWVFVFLAIYILVRCILSLMKSKNPGEVWAYMNMKTYESVGNGEIQLVKEESMPISHWENVIGRGKSCDISVSDDTLSRNHGILMRYSDGTWTYRDLGSKNGSYLGDEEDVEKGEFIKISKDKAMSNEITLEYGDTLRAGMTEFTLMPVSLEEKNNNINMRRMDTKLMSYGPTLAAITLFQVLTVIQFWLVQGSDNLIKIIPAIGGLCLTMWVYTGILAFMGRKGFEMEAIAFFLSTLNLAVVASSSPGKLPTQFMAILLGVCLMFFMCLVLRNLDITKKLRWVILIATVMLLIINLVIGTVSFGARNWISIGGMTFQPSELVKIAFIWIGAATLDELFQKKNLWLFMGFSMFCFACLGLMGDFGTALIFFVTFLIISFLRSGDFSKLFLISGVAAAGGFVVLRFKPYVAARFMNWGHAWDPALIDAAGYQQTRTMSAAASGGLVGVGAGDGWLHNVAAADTDMVFGMITEEWGLIIALLAVGAIITLSIFSVGSITAGRSTYYTIASCGAMSMFVFQTILNIFGSMDLLPFTGVTLPFLSNGGTSMIVSWGLLSFLKAQDTRFHASLAVRGGGQT